MKDPQRYSLPSLPNPFPVLCLVLLLLSACDKSGEETAARMKTSTSDSTMSSLPTPPASGDRHLISAAGIGGVRLGMTLNDVRRALPNATFERTVDADGVAFVNVIVGAEDSIMLYAGEENPDAPIDWGKKVELVQTFSSAFHTAEGIEPGSLVTAAEKVYGKTVGVMKSEIESRQYITFAKGPKGLTFRLDYTGIFAPDSSRTTEVDPNGRILSIEVSSPPSY